MHRFNSPIAGLLSFAADTGGATAVAGAPTSPDTTTPASKPRTARGGSVTRFASKDEAMKAKEAKGDKKFNVYTAAQYDIGADGKPVMRVKTKGADGKEVETDAQPKAQRFYLSNHRSAVMLAILGDFGIALTSGSGKRVGGRVADPAKAAERATKAIAALSEEDRRKLFEQFMSSGNVAAVARSSEPALPPRNDTTPEFAATQAPKANAPKAAAVTAGAKRR
jgi:hypothetical protein